MTPRAPASDLLDITVLAPELKFINLLMSVDPPFKPPRVRGLRLEEAVADLGARWHQTALDHVEPERNRVITRNGDELHTTCSCSCSAPTPKRNGTVGTC